MITSVKRTDEVSMVEFQILHPGDTFMYKDEIYIVVYNDGYFIPIALERAAIAHFKPDDLVTPVNLTIEWEFTSSLER